MAQIDPLLHGQLAGNYIAPKEDKKRPEKKGSIGKTFETMIRRDTEKMLGASFVDGPAEDLPFEELLDNIHEAGERLSGSPGMSEVMIYKQAVRNFIKYVVSNSFELIEEEGVKFANPMKKQKKFTMVKIIDEKLEKLASQILQNQKSKLEILAAVEEIQGLLIDLLQ